MLSRKPTPRSVVPGTQWCGSSQRGQSFRPNCHCGRPGTVRHHPLEREGLSRLRVGPTPGYERRHPVGIAAADLPRRRGELLRMSIAACPRAERPHALRNVDPPPRHEHHLQSAAFSYPRQPSCRRWAEAIVPRPGVVLVKWQLHHREAGLLRLGELLKALCHAHCAASRVGGGTERICHE
jgi:hypothetical protein